MAGELIIEFDFDSTTPVWRQLHDALVEMAASGELPAEHRLPPVRVFAADLDLAPGTVARVYRDLETEGIVETRGRHGTFVTADARQVRDDAERLQILEEGARHLVSAALQVGAGEDEAIAVFRNRFRGNGSVDR